MSVPYAEALLQPNRKPGEDRPPPTNFWEKHMTKLLDKLDMARLHGVTVRTIERWTRAGQLPAPIRRGRRSYWPEKIVTEPRKEGKG